MATENLILVRQFCTSHEIEISFVESLQEYGLIEITVIGQETYIPVERLNDLEKMIRLHYDLQVNMEGIDIISGLLQKIDSLQKESQQLKNRLNFYE